MVETITLSIPAVDVLGEQLNLAVRQYPFEIPRLGEGPEDRSRLAHQVWQELESAGLARSGRPEPEVEDALYLLCSSEVSIAAAGLLDVRAGQRLAARIVATGEVGVVGVVEPRGLRMSFVAPDVLPRAAADLLPDAPTGSAQPVRAVADRSAGPPSDAAIHGLAELRAITGRPKFRLGHFAVTGIDRGRRGDRLPNLVWFDNDRGRHLLQGERSDTEDVVTCGPGDKREVADRLAGLVDRARDRG
ncbi:ESX secretion-associated protein EspG [Saccharopolyspora sp. HNM0983]|uniref:ESX secretion-associated protein EspG n=1 Tax=Saccharopolyspora montiporae TaxID=2781240 RepID=A0A929B941_9PSEU|nr:ESX secretion-associated protein EspG [Saccharopolyspora sp. HNM0983]MBE9374095.1 ESX secretion-associated protein EspG [Saccharopolyspora sp. HNM0983]